MRSRSCDTLWRVVRSSLTYAVSADSLTPSPEVLRESICACVPIAVATPSLPQTPDLFLPKSRLCRFSWHHRAFAVCSFSDIWGLSTPRGVVRRAVDGKHSQPAHQTCRLEQICHVKRNREEGKTGVVRGQYGSSVFYNPVLFPCNILSPKYKSLFLKVH